jgi:hypothetical protein
MKEPKDLLSLNEVENSVDNLEMVAYFLENIPSKKKWKWAIIALHQALYGFAICASQGFIQKTVIKPDGELVSIWKAIDLAKEISPVSPDYLKPLILSVEEEIAIEKLVKQFRNEFEHFKPIEWGIVVSGLPDIFVNILRVIRFLALESDRVNCSQSDLIKIDKTLQHIQNLIQQPNT